MKREPTENSLNRVARKLGRAVGWATLGFAATAIPLHLLLRSELRDAPEDVRAQGWPIRLMHMLFLKYVIPWIDVQGLENLPEGSYVIAANHAYRSGVDGFILGHLLATKARRVPRILMTAENRNWVIRAERWVLHHYGIALLVPDEAGPLHHRLGLSDIIATYLRASTKHAVLIFPAGRAIADPQLQLKNWSTGAVVAAKKSGCPVVPVAVGGLHLDWTPETVIFAAIEAEEAEPPFEFHVRIGRPIIPTGDTAHDLDLLRVAVAGLMEQVPGLQPALGESMAGFGKMTLHDGRTLAYMDCGPRTGTPVFYFHGFQGSRLERVPGLDEILTKLNIRIIAPDRPGIGLSTPSHARTVTGWANDVGQLVEWVLGPKEPFSIMGFSAGATYALACGHLPGLQAISLVSGMGLPHLIAGWRRYSQEAWYILLSAKLAEFRSATFLKIEKKNRDLILDKWEEYFSGVKRDLSPDDQRILSRTDVEELFRENRREGQAQGAGSLLKEVQSLYSDPQIDLQHPSACEVSIIHGTDDRVVPVEVARDLHRRIPGSKLRELPGRGHYFLYDDGQMKTLLTELTEAHRLCLLDRAG